MRLFLINDVHSIEALLTNMVIFMANQRGDSVWFEITSLTTAEGIIKEQEDD